MKFIAAIVVIVLSNVAVSSQDFDDHAIFEKTANTNSGKNIMRKFNNFSLNTIRGRKEKRYNYFNVKYKLVHKLTV